MGIRPTNNDYAAAIGRTIDRASSDASVPAANQSYRLNVRDV